MKKPDKIEEFDFGFSFSDEIPEETKTKIIDIETRLQLLYDNVIPFLDNLCKNPEKTTIHWPDRVSKIEAYKRKLKDIMEGNI